MHYTIILPNGLDFGSLLAPDKKSALIIAGVSGARAVPFNSKAAQKARAMRTLSDISKRQEEGRA